MTSPYTHPQKMKIKGLNNMIRDATTGAVLNTDLEEIKRFQHQRATDERLNKLESKLNRILYLLEQQSLEK